ncbi:MAG: FG-GAP repeat protein [Planctomycetota bacterium]
MRLSAFALLSAATSTAPAIAVPQVVDEQRVDQPTSWHLHAQIQYGYKLASHGDTFLVTTPGYPRTSGPQAQSGIVLCFERDPASGEWALDQEIRPITPRRNSLFGIGLDLDPSGNRAIVGAPYESIYGPTLNFAGAAYVFDRDPATGVWSESQRLEASNLSKDDYFGYDVVLRGDTAVVAAPLAGATQNGILYVFERNASGVWIEQQLLTAALPGPWPVLGENLSFDGDVLVAGSGTFVSSAATPAVVFRRAGPGTPFQYEQDLFGGNLPFYLPLDVSISGDRVLVGSREQVDVLPGEGRVYLHEFDGGTGQWTLSQTFSPLDPITEHFGFSVDLRGGVALIGNYYHDSDNPTQAPGPLTQVLFEQPAGGWTMEVLGDPAPAGTRWFASETAVGDATVFAHRGFTSLPDPSDVNAFSLASAPIGVPSCAPATPNSAGLQARLVGRGTADVDANALALEATALPPFSTGFLLVGPQQQTGTVPPGSQGVLCLGGAIGRYSNQAQTADGSGRALVAIDTLAIQQPTGAIAAMAGQSWSFQYWYRDANPTVTSNLTEVSTVTFR